MKALLLYNPIYSYTAEEFVTRLNEIDPAEDVDIWMNSPGGSVFAGWSIIGPLNERKGKNNAKVFGSAASMAFYMLLFMDYVEAIDVSTFMVHRADGYIEKPEDQEWLNSINKMIRQKLEMKIDAEVFSQVTGKTFDEIFATDKRIDVVLTAKQALKIGLVNKITRLEPGQIKAMSEKFVAFAEFDSFGERGSKPDDQQERGSSSGAEKIITPKKVNMNKAELKSQHPELYAEVFNSGVMDERDRVNAFLKFVEIDPKAVAENIASGAEPSRTFYADMQVKQIAPAKLAEAKNEAPAAVAVVPEEPKAEVNTEAVEFAKKVNESAGIKEDK